MFVKLLQALVILGVHPGGIAGGGVGWGAPAALLEEVGQHAVCIIWY